jgi:hypothetical protein
MKPYRKKSVFIRIKPKISVLMPLILILIGGCAAHSTPQKQKLANAVESGKPPKSMAVLPSLNHTSVEGLQKNFRSYIFGHLTVLPYRDMELSEVDTRLRDNHLLENYDFTRIPVQELGRILGCDAVVMTELTAFYRIFLGIYSQMTVKGNITIWDTHSGSEIWTDTQVIRKHEGGIPLALIDLPLISVRSGLHLRNNNREKIIDALSERLIAGIPAPACILDAEEGKVKYAYELQVGAYLTKENAYTIKKDLIEKGYSAKIRSNRDDQGLWHRVFIGTYEDQEVALKHQMEIRKKFGVQPVIARFLLNNSDEGKQFE